MNSNLDLQIKRWELDAIVIELVVLSGVAMGVAVGFLSRLSTLGLPLYILNGIGFAGLGMLLIPVQSILIRVHRQHQISVRGSVAWCVVGAVVFIGVSRMMQ